MPYEAIDPGTLQLKSIDWFREQGLHQGMCDVCGSMMTIRADKTLAYGAHFWHGPKPSGCPTSLANRPMYHNLPASVTNDALGKLLKEQVKNNLHTVYLACQAIIDGPVKKDDFLDALQRANAINVWAYDHLSLEYVPYVLLCFIDTHRQSIWLNNKKTSLDTHFILDSKVANLDDLWNKGSVIKQNIWQMDKKGNVLKRIPIKPDLNTIPPYFGKWVKKAFP